MNDANLCRRPPCLSGMIQTQVIGNGENGIGERIVAVAQEAATTGKPIEHINFVAVLAVDRDGYSCEAGSENRLNTAPVARVNDVRSKFFHCAYEPEEGELTIVMLLARTKQLVFEEWQRGQVGIEASYRAKSLLE